MRVRAGRAFFAMRLAFLNQDVRLAERAREIVCTLRAHGFTAYFAGGCVRDALRGAPVKDIDIASSATPEEVAALFPSQSVGVGKSFGVMLVVLEGVAYDVATFRTDGGYQDGRHPERVIYDTAEHDAQRRDFTVNALFYDPIEARVIDFVGGVADLRAGILRTVGEATQRFREDRLRMLRAIRFATVCQWQIAPETWQALKAEAPNLPCVSIERIRSEFLRMLCEAPLPSRALELLAESGLLACFFPELLKLRGCLQDPIWHPEGDVWVHTARMLDLAERPRSVPLVWAALLHDIGKPAALQVGVKPDGSPAYRTPNHAALGATLAEAILRRFKESRETIEAVCAAVAGHMQFVELPKMKPATARRFLGRATIALELQLHRLDCLSSHAKLDLYEMAQARLAQYAHEPILPPALLTGRDLLACGYRPGPAMGEKLKALYALQLEGATREVLLEAALCAAPPLPDRARRALFVFAPNAPFPLRSAWERLCESADWAVTLLVLPGQYWGEAPNAARRVWRVVTDCAGNADYPALSGFDLAILPHPMALPLSHGTPRLYLTPPPRKK